MRNLSLFEVSLFNKCPSCQKTGIYASLLGVKDECEVCGFALKNHDAGDGPAFFAMFITATIVSILAVLAEIFMRPPLWLHMIVWSVLTIVLSIFFLRVIKSGLIALQYKYNVLGYKKKK